MKMPSKFSRLLLPILALQLNLFAQEDGEKENKKYEFVKTKSVNKSYSVGSDDRLSVENSFGRVEVRTWDRSEVKVDVTIEVSATRENLAQKIFEGISVSESQNGKEISFKTTIKGNNNGSKGEKSNMNVNYIINMPAGNRLKIENSFGKTIVPDFRGEVDLVSKFGSLTAGNLSNVKNLEVEFGKSTVESINNGKVSVKYSKATLGKISGNVKMNLEFSSGIKLDLQNDLSGLDLKASYSTVNLKPSAGLSASYSIFTSFGSLKNNTAIKFDSDEDDGNKGVKFDHRYNGKSGSGNVHVKINSSFSTVILGEPGPDDMKDKNKNKNKNKAI